MTELDKFLALNKQLQQRIFIDESLSPEAKAYNTKLQAARKTWSKRAGTARTEEATTVKKWKKELENVLEQLDAELLIARAEQKTQADQRREQRTDEQIGDVDAQTEALAEQRRRLEEKRRQAEENLQSDVRREEAMIKELQAQVAESNRKLEEANTLSEERGQTILEQEEDILALQGEIRRLEAEKDRLRQPSQIVMSKDDSFLALEADMRLLVAQKKALEKQVEIALIRDAAFVRMFIALNAAYVPDDELVKLEEEFEQLPEIPRTEEGSSYSALRGPVVAAATSTTVMSASVADQSTMLSRNLYKKEIRSQQIFKGKYAIGVKADSLQTTFNHCNIVTVKDRRLYGALGGKNDLLAPQGTLKLTVSDDGGAPLVEKTLAYKIDMRGTNDKAKHFVLQSAGITVYLARVDNDKLRLKMLLLDAK